MPLAIGYVAKVHEIQEIPVKEFGCVENINER
jgi:hypothetical protein